MPTIAIDNPGADEAALRSAIKALRDTVDATTFWADVDGGTPRIDRRRGRLFLGNAALMHSNRAGNNDTIFGTDADGARWAVRDAQFGVISENGSEAIVGMSRASDSDGIASPPPVMGVGGFTKNNTTVVGRQAWSLYADVLHDPDASISGQAQSFGLESALKNRSIDISGHPYGVGYGVHGWWVQCGGDPSYGGTSVNPINSVMTVIKGGHTANRGIIFAADALTGTDGVTGTGIAMALARGHTLRWYYAGGNTGASIRSDVDTATTNAQSLVFANAATQLFNSAGVRSFQARSVTNGVNFIDVLQSIASSPVEISAQGSDSNINFKVSAKGTGALQGGTSGMFAANGSVAVTLTSLGPTGASTTIRKWLRLLDNSGTEFFIPMW